MMNYKTCPYCGAHLDPGEQCDCRENEKEPEDSRGRAGSKATNNISAYHRREK